MRPSQPPFSHCLIQQRIHSGVKHLEEIREAGLATPAVNQIELHPFCQQRPIVEYCRERGIAVQAFCPLVRGKFSDPVLQEVARTYKKDVAQVLVRWSLQRGCVAPISCGLCLRGGVCADTVWLWAGLVRCPSQRSQSASCPMWMCTILRYRKRIWRRSTGLTEAQRARLAGISDGACDRPGHCVLGECMSMQAIGSGPERRAHLSGDALC